MLDQEEAEREPLVLIIQVAQDHHLDLQEVQD
jgi:hypothetical protein